jgi:hypothetical protein
MKTTTNELGQQIGYPVKDYISPPFPNITKLEGATVVIEPIENSHLIAFYKDFSLDSTGANWTYVPFGPFLNEEEFRQFNNRLRDGPSLNLEIRKQGLACNQPHSSTPYVRATERDAR